MSLEEYVEEAMKVVERLRAGYGGRYMLIKGRSLVGAFQSRADVFKKIEELEPGIYVLAYVPAEGEVEF